MSEFRDFIISLLKRGNINKKHLAIYTDDAAMQQFENAFTHKSYDPDTNYELVELIGDSIVNLSVVRYLREWNPDIVSVKYLTRLKHNITSKTELAYMAESAGFWKYIKISQELQDKFSPMTPDYKHKNKEYMSILEDCFEAFVGTVSIIIDERSKVSGPGTEIAYQIVKSFLQKLNISLKYEDIFDAKTRYKEFCDKRGWDFGTAMKTREIRDEKRYFEVTVIGYPFGNKRKEDDNKEVLAVYKGPLKIEAQNKAAEIALEKLEKCHHLSDIQPNPFHKKN